MNDLRYALRTFAKNPGFTAVAVATLALGIGANSAIFSVVNAVLLRPLPYAEPDRLVEIRSVGMGGRARFGISYPDYHDLAALGDALAGIAAYTTERYNLTGAGDPRETQGALVTPNLFELLGAHPVLGRTFTAADTREPIVILSYSLWRAAFGGDRGVIGRPLTLDGRAYTVVGVLPATFRFPNDEIELWAPIGWAFAADPQAETNRGYHAFSSVARLAPGATLARLRGDLDVLGKRIEAAQQAVGGNRRIEGRVTGGPPPSAGGGGRAPRMVENGFSVTTLNEEVVGDAGRAILIMFGAVGIVLLIACVNAANLLVARGTTRRKEIAIRQAIGADRRRLVRQLLTESVTLSLGAGVVGLLFSVWSLDALLATWPAALPRAPEIGIDVRVLVFTLALALLTGLGFGLLPAWRASGLSLDEALRDETGGSGGRRRHRLQSALVVSEVALALVLLVSAGLLVRSFVRLNAVDPGFDTRGLLAARIRLTPARYATPVAQQEFFRQLTEALAARAGVTGVTMARTLPLSGAMMMLAMDPRRVRPDSPDQFLTMGLSVVGPDYFSTLRIPIRAGRAFTRDDGAGAPKVVIVNTRLADRLWPGESPVGRAFPVVNPRGPDVTATVVGVVGDLHSAALEEPPGPAMYLPAAQGGGAEQMWVVLRAARSPLALAPALREAVGQLDHDQPIGELVSLEQLIRQQEAARRFNLSLLALFAALAVLLALVGIHAVTAYAVAQRTREFGIRLALGASGRDVVWHVVAEYLVLVGIGVGVGLGLAVAATRVLATMLYDVRPTDAPTFAATALLLGAVALLSSWLPARRAARVDPMVALRYE